MLVVVRRMAFAALWVVRCVVLAAPPARAQTVEGPATDALAAARALFADALRDEEAGRFAEALQKFQRVRAVRDTAAIEYRIGSCYEGLGEPVPAYVAYRQARGLGQPDPQSADVVKAAADRLAVLDRHVARLSLVLPRTLPADAQVRVDDAVVREPAPDSPIPLAPGNHVVAATGAGVVPFRTEIALPEGTQASLTISLEPEAPPRPMEVLPAGSFPLGGWLVIAGGAVLLGTSATFFVVRGGDIAKLDRSCPQGSCPAGSDRADLESTRSRALWEGPVAIACGVAGAAAVLAGAYFVVNARPSSGSSRRVIDVRVAPLLARAAGGLSLRGMFP